MQHFRLRFGISHNLAAFVSGPVREVERCRDVNLATDSFEGEIFRERGEEDLAVLETVLRQETKEERERTGERTNGFQHPPPSLPRSPSGTLGPPPSLARHSYA